MQLISIQVSKFRNIIDSSVIEIDDKITCLVGKNESGKTALLHALNRLKPARENVVFSVPDQYPAWLLKRDEIKGVNIDEVTPVKATFILKENELESVAEMFGGETIVSKNIEIKKEYSGKLIIGIDISESNFVKHIINTIDWPRGTKTDANTIKDLNGLKAYSDRLKADNGEENQVAANSIDESLQLRLNGQSLDQAVCSHIETLIPKMLYFAQYSLLPYSVDIKKLLRENESNLTDAQLTARSLLKMAAADDDYLNNTDYERRKRELENIANAITDDVLEYWSQNPELRVHPDITLVEETTPNGKQAVSDELKIRIWDQRHSLSLPFDEHSTGFRWFFSFLAAFSEYERNAESLIILLDEPALGLHARAQSDFLRFIEERLAPNSNENSISSGHQVIYSTHSPFMVQPGKLNRVRLVEDKGREQGSKTTADVTSTDPDTLFPLQGALGYDLSQHLFIAPHNLVVEGTSDYTYLRVISDYFKTTESRTCLNDKWSIVPVGGVDLVPTFVALLGNHLDLTVLIDAQKGGHQKLSNLVAQGILKEKRIITVGNVANKKVADIEDLFEPGEYIELYNKAFSEKVKESDLVGNDPIVRQIARYFNVDRFDHGVPADQFLKTRDEYLPRLCEETLNRFEELFKIINATLPVD